MKSHPFTPSHYRRRNRVSWGNVDAGEVRSTRGAVGADEIPPGPANSVTAKSAILARLVNQRATQIVSTLGRTCDSG